MKASLQKYKKNALIFFGITILIAFIYYIATRKRTFVRYTGRFPYIISKTLNESLIKYVKTTPSRNVLLLTGPYQSGKSRILQLLAKELIKNGRLVVEIDFSSIETQKEAFNHVLLATTKGLAKIETLNSEKRDLFISEIKSCLTDSPDGLNRYIDVLERYHNSLMPAIFVHSSDQLKSAAPDAWNAVFYRLSRRSLFQDFVPIVCETHYTSYRLNKSYQMPSWIREIDVGSYKHEDAVFISTIQTRALSALELQKIEQSFGGHGGTTERIFESLKRGISIDSAIAIENRAIEAFIKRHANKTDCSELSQEKVAPLLSTGHYYITKNKEILPANSAVPRFFCIQQENL